MTELEIQKVTLELAPEIISLEVANMADLSCPGCSISPIEE